jgi:hypothetical protein
LRWLDGRQQACPPPATLGKREIVFMRTFKSGLVTILTIGLLAGSVVGVAAQDAESPTEFTGRWVYSHTLSGGDEDGGVWAYATEEMTDPRLDGSISLTGNRSALDDKDSELWSSVFRIENEEGAWEEVPGLLVRFDEATASVRTGLFMGEGAYKGLVAVAELAWDLSGPSSAFDVRGVVLDGEDLPSPVTDDAP